MERKNCPLYARGNNFDFMSDTGFFFLCSVCTYKGTTLPFWSNSTRKWSPL